MTIQLILTVISYVAFYGCLFLIVIFLGLHAVRSGKRQTRLQDALIDSNKKSSEAAQQAAQAAHLLATYLERKP